MELNASMNTTTTERFNVSGALLVKLFGRTDQETEDFRKRADRVRRVGVRSAVYGRTFFFSLGLSGALAVAAFYGIGGPHVIRTDEHTSELQTLMLRSYAVFSFIQKIEN